MYPKLLHMPVPKWFNLTSAHLTDSSSVPNTISLSTQMIHLFSYFKTQDNKHSTDSLERWDSPGFGVWVVHLECLGSNPGSTTCWLGDLGQVT